MIKKYKNEIGYYGFTGLQTKQKRQLVLTPLCSLARVFFTTPQLS